MHTALGERSGRETEIQLSKGNIAKMMGILILMGVFLNFGKGGNRSIELHVKMKGWNKAEVRWKMDEAMKSVQLAQLLLVHIMSLQI